MGERKKKKTSWVILMPVIRTWIGQALQATYNTYIFTVQVDDVHTTQEHPVPLWLDECYHPLVF